MPEQQETTSRPSRRSPILARQSSGRPRRESSVSGASCGHRLSELEMPAVHLVDCHLNGSETDVDCGGICAKCPNGKTCTQGFDCASTCCVANVCKQATCSDAVKNGAETDVNCGGGTCPICMPAQSCRAPTDCNAGVCTGGVCSCPEGGDCHCWNRALDGDESDLDCGGSCRWCSSGQSCSFDSAALRTCAVLPPAGSATTAARSPGLGVASKSCTKSSGTQK